MANPTSVFATGDGSTTDRNFPFPYISRSHVKVTVDGVAVSFSFIAQNTVRISPAPATGKSIRIYRETPKTPIINWEDPRARHERVQHPEHLYRRRGVQ